MKYLIPCTFLLCMLIFSCGGEASESEVDSNSIDSLVSNDTIDTAQTDSIVVEKMTVFELEEYANDCDPSIEELNFFWETFKVSQVEFDEIECDQVFHAYVILLNRVGYAFGEHEDTEAVDRDAKAYYPYGFVRWYEEGYTGMMLDMRVAGSLFRPFISEDCYFYSNLGKYEGTQLMGDAAMAYSYVEWLDFLWELEDWVIEAKDSPYRDDFINQYKSMLYWFMWGVDNTPILDWGEEKKLNEDVKEAYDKAIADETHHTHKIIRDHLAYLESVNFEFEWSEVEPLDVSEVLMYFDMP